MDPKRDLNAKSGSSSAATISFSVQHEQFEHFRNGAVFRPIAFVGVHFSLTCANDETGRSHSPEDAPPYLKRPWRGEGEIWWW
jgi:hypothetical protein